VNELTEKCKFLFHAETAEKTSLSKNETGCLVSKKLAIVII
jgi:hypothetical protein